MSPLDIIDLVLTVIFLVIAIAAFGYVWLDVRKDRAEAALDRHQQEILQLAAQLSCDLRSQGFDARRALIRAVQQAPSRTPDEE